MVKSNFSLGGKLLTIFLTLVIFIGAIAGTLVAVYKLVKVRTITGWFGAENWISEDYDGTIEDFVLKVSETLKGEITVNKLLEISPALGDYIDEIVDNVENVGLFKFDRDALYSTNVSELSSSLMNVIVLTASLGDLSEQMNFPLPDLDIITGNEENPVAVYTRVNDTESGAVDKVFDEKYSGKTYTFLTRSEKFFTKYTDDAGQEQDVVQHTPRTLYTLSGVTVVNNVLKHEGATLYLEQRNGSAAVRSALTKNNDAVYEISGDTITFALLSGESICKHTAPGSDDAAYTNVPLNDTGKSVSVATVAAPYRYKPLYVRAESAPAEGEFIENEGFFFLPANRKDENGAYVVDPDNGGFEILEEYEGQALYFLDYSYSEADPSETDAPLYIMTNGIKDLPLVYGMTAFSTLLDMNALSLRDVGIYFGVDLDNDLFDMVKYVPFAYLSASMTNELNGMYVKDVLPDITPDSSPLLKFIAYGEEGVDYRIVDGKFEMLGNARPKTIADLTGSLDEMKISSVIDIVTDEEAENDPQKTPSHPLMQAIKDWSLNDFSDSNKIGSLTIGDVLDIVTDEEAIASGKPASPGILQLLEDIALDDVGNSIDSFTVGDILGNDLNEDDKILSLLKNSTLKTLSSDLQKTTVQMMFSDSIYAYHTVAEISLSEDEDATISQLDELYAAHKDDYHDLLYVYIQGKNVLYSEFRASYQAGDAVPVRLLSPYLLVKRADETLSAQYEGVPLYFLESVDGVYTYRLASRVTGWQLPQGMSGRFYLDRNGAEAAVADSDGLYSVDTLYRWDAASEKLKKVDLVAARYETPDADGKALYSRLKPTTYSGTDFVSEYGNLFYYDMVKENWVQIPLVADPETKTYTLGTADGFDPAVLDGKTLFTYGTPAGGWKYLIMSDGIEVSCAVQNVDSLMNNVTDNINKLTLRQLYEDGMVSINPPSGSSVKDVLNKDVSKFNVPNCNTLGDLTLNGMINLIFNIASLPIIP